MNRPISVGLLGITFLVLQSRTARGQAQSLEGGYRMAIAESRTLTGSVAGGPFFGFRLAHSGWPLVGIDALWVPPATAIRSGNTHRERSVQAGLSFRFSPPQRVLFFELALGRSWVTYSESGTDYRVDPRTIGLAYLRLGTGVRVRVGSRGPLILAGLRHQWASHDFLDGDYSVRKGVELIVGIGLE